MEVLCIQGQGLHGIALCCVIWKEYLTHAGPVQSWEPDLVAAGGGLQAVTYCRAKHEAYGLLHCYSPTLQGDCNTRHVGVNLHVGSQRVIRVSFFILFATCHEHEHNKSQSCDAVSIGSLRPLAWLCLYGFSKFARLPS